MNKNNLQEELNLLRRLKQKPETSQRELASILGFSLGKLNYCLIALKNKGLVKINNFSKQKDKIKYARYALTPKGIAYRTKLTLEFMNRKMKEYEELKKEFENITKKK
jgi:MarR family transcriptional regulator, temperature-dependent positive regulator of motility